MGLWVHNGESDGFKLPWAALEEERVVRFVGQAAGVVVRQTHGGFLVGICTTPMSVWVTYGFISLRQSPFAHPPICLFPLYALVVEHLLPVKDFEEVMPQNSFEKMKCDTIIIDFTLCRALCEHISIPIFSWRRLTRFQRVAWERVLSGGTCPLLVLI